MLERGFEIIDGFISETELGLLNNGLSQHKFISGVGGIRNIDKKCLAVNNFCLSEKMMNKASKYLSGKASLVRAIIFNKTEEQNWLVSWHQDKTVAVSTKFEKEGWGPWSIKDGIYHVQPPLEVLNQMVCFRIHLDASNLDNGCLKVIPDSHLLGIIKQEKIVEALKSEEQVDCEVSKGAALIMRPHLLHSSAKAKIPSQRRVLHLEYTSYQLPHGTTWL